MDDTSEYPADEQAKEQKLGPHFGDIGAVWVEWGSPEHLSMQHSRLRGDTRRRPWRGRRPEPILSKTDQATPKASE